jgi:hypothetical protein
MRHSPVVTNAFKVDTPAETKLAVNYLVFISSNPSGILRVFIQKRHQ